MPLIFGAVTLCRQSAKQQACHVSSPVLKSMSGRHCIQSTEVLTLLQPFARRRRACSRAAAPRADLAQHTDGHGHAALAGDMRVVMTRRHTGIEVIATASCEHGLRRVMQARELVSSVPSLWLQDHQSNGEGVLPPSRRSSPARRDSPSYLRQHTKLHRTHESGRVGQLHCPSRVERWSSGESVGGAPLVAVERLGTGRG